MNPFRPVKLACEVRLAALRARSERLSKEIEVAAQAVKMAAEAEASHEKLSPSKPRAAAKPAKTK